jgi:hypothetical protein
MRLWNQSIRLIMLMVMVIVSQLFAGYGDATDGYPSHKERQIIVLTNVCRMSPIAYRDTFVGNYSILLPAHYPAVNPLYWNPQLNRSARAHCLDMGDTCGIMQHPSCNGTAWNTRLRSYYTPTGYGYSGENIAAGNIDPIETMSQWILDILQSTGAPAGDSTICVNGTQTYQCDGHRANIMSPNYREIGTGYIYGTHAALAYHSLWTQDFGGNAATYTNPVVSGSHFIRANGTVMFLVNYYDSAGQTPLSASLVLEGTSLSMTLFMGTAARGTYRVIVARTNTCRNYFFQFTTALVLSSGIPKTDIWSPRAMDLALRSI